MYWSRLLTLLSLVAVVVGVAGAVVGLMPALGESSVVVTVALVAGAVVLVSLVGARRGRRLSTPYW